MKGRNLEPLGRASSIRLRATSPGASPDSPVDSDDGSNGESSAYSSIAEQDQRQVTVAIQQVRHYNSLDDDATSAAMTITPNRTPALNETTTAIQNIANLRTLGDGGGDGAAMLGSWEPMKKGLGAPLFQAPNPYMCILARMG